MSGLREDDWRRRFARTMLRARVALLAVVLALTAIASVFALQVRFEQSLDIWFLDDDPDLVSYEQFLERFEGDELGVIGVFADDVFSPDVLAAIERMTTKAEGAPFVLRVRSLTNVRIARSFDDSIEIGELVEDLPRSAEAAADLRATALANPVVVGTLVAADGRAAAIGVEMGDAGNTFESKVALTDALRAIVEAEDLPGIELRLAGTPVFDAAFYEYMQADYIRAAPLMVLLIMAACFLVFRRFSAALIPLTVVGVATVWTLGTMGATGASLNIVSSILVALILAVGVADSVHILSDYYQQLMVGRSPEEAVEDAVAHLLIPCFFTSATTAAGFLALQVSDLEPIRSFGLFAALAVNYAFVVSFTLVPSLLRFARPPAPEFVARQSHGPLARALDTLGRPTRRSSAVVLALCIPLVLASVAAIPTLRAGSNPINYFRPGDPVRNDIEALDEALGGTSSIEFLVHAPEQGMKDPRQLARLEAFQAWLEEDIGVSRALSAVDTLKDMNRTFHPGDEDAYRLPDSRALAAQYYLLMEGEEDFDTLVQDDYGTGRITARVRTSAATDFAHDLPRIEARLGESFAGDDLRVESTGFIKLMFKMEEYLVASQVRSFVLAFVVITLMMIALLRSIRLGLFSMIPNFVPIVVGVGFMAGARIDLDPATVMIGSIAIGLVVDDTVHFLVRLRHHLTRGRSLEEGIHATMTETGRAIVVTSLILIAGFAVNMLGSFNPNFHFGLVSALVILLALLADLVMLPAALVLVRPRS